MANINDLMFAALGAQGFTGSLNERTRQWLWANGATSRNINDAWRQMLVAQGFGGHVNDALFALLGSLGYVGHLNDRLHAFWLDGGALVTTPPRTLIYTMGAGGTVETWTTETTPYTLINAIADYPGAQAHGIDWAPGANLLAIGYQDLYVYDISTMPFTLVQTIPAASIPGAGTLSTVRIAYNGTRIFVGNNAAANNYIINTSDWSIHLISAIPVNDAAVNIPGTRLFTTTTGIVAGRQLKRYDISGAPFEMPALAGIADGSVMDHVGIHPVHGSVVSRFDGGNQLLGWASTDTGSAAALAMAGWGSGFLQSMRFNFSGSRLLRFSTSAAAPQVYDTTAATFGSWAALTVDAGATIAATSFRGGASFSFGGNLLACRQSGFAGDRRIVFDLAQNPIVRVPSFDTQPGTPVPLQSAIIEYVEPI